MAAEGERFNRCMRLQQAAEFAEVFDHRRVLKGEWFYLHYGPVAEKPRLGLVIAKKHARRAVARNLLKRIGRECFRRKRAELTGRHLIIRLVRPVKNEMCRDLARRLGWRDEIDALLQRLPA